MGKEKGKLYVVGLGPGHHDHMTFRAKQAIEESNVIIGYDTYVSLIDDIISGKEVYRYPMTQEVDRANQAIEFAEKGKIVSLVSSGDPGIYGMIGSPLMTDFAVVSMSDLLVPWNIITKRVEAAAQGDYVTVIYNPSSKKRVHQLSDTRDIFLKFRKPDTPVAIVKGAYRESQSIVMTTLDKMLEYPDMLGMITTVIVGNSSTFNFKGMMINPRGYRSKYQLVKEASSVTAQL